MWTVGGRGGIVGQAREPKACTGQKARSRPASWRERINEASTESGGRIDSNADHFGLKSQETTNCRYM